MKTVFMFAVGMLAIFATLTYIDAIDAGCGHRAARVQARRDARHMGRGSCSSSSMTTTTTVTRTFQSVQGCQGGSCAVPQTATPKK